MASCRRVVVIVIGGVCASAVSLARAPSPILLEQRQREVVLARHLREHVIAPADGLSLAADRRDLQRLRSGTPPSIPMPLASTVTDDVLVDSLRVIADLWYARLVDRTPFGLMPRSRVAGLGLTQQSPGQLQSRRGRSGLDLWWSEAQLELNALVQAASGQGEVADAAIDVALLVADAAATGRPVIAPGPYGVVGPPIGGSPGPVAGPHPGATLYALPPGYEAYRGAAAAGVEGIAACQTLRAAAGLSQGVSDMIRAAECWARTPTWPGWGAQSLEALDWATSLAAVERNCTALVAAIDALREAGPRLSAGGLTTQVMAISRRAESDRRRLRGQSLCR